MNPSRPTPTTHIAALTVAVAVALFAAPAVAQEAETPYQRFARDVGQCFTTSPPAECGVLRTGLGRVPTAVGTAGVRSVQRAGGLSESAALTGIFDFVFARVNQEALAMLRRFLYDDLCANESPMKGVFPRTCQTLEDTSQLSRNFFRLGPAVQDDLISLPGTVFLHLFNTLPRAPEAKVSYCIAASGGLALLPGLDSSSTGDFTRVALYLRHLNALTYAAEGATPPAEDALALNDGETALMRRCESAIDEPRSRTAWTVFKRSARLAHGAFARYAAARTPAPAAGTAAVFTASSDASSVALHAALSRSLEAAGQLTLTDGAPAAVASPYDELLAPLGELMDAYNTHLLAPGDAEKSKAFAHKIVNVTAVAAQIALRDANAPAQTRAVAEFLGAIDSLIEADYGRAAVRATAAFDTLLRTSPTPNIARLGQALALFGSIASARTAAEVTAALDAAAAPLGSWNAYHEGCSLFVGAQLGVIGGYELNTTDRGGQDGWFVGPSLPLGLSLGGRFPWTNGGASYRLSVSVLDLGSLVSARLTRATAEANGNGNGLADAGQDITFARAFAPAVAFGISLGRNPLLFQLGAQYAPLARDYIVCSGAVCSTESQHSLRFFATVTFDVPIFRLF